MASDDGMPKTARARIAHFLAGGDLDTKTLRESLRELREHDPDTLAEILQRGRGYATSCRDIAAVLADYRAYAEHEARRRMPAVALHLAECADCTQSLNALREDSAEAERGEWLALSRQLAGEAVKAAVVVSQRSVAGAWRLGVLPPLAADGAKPLDPNPSAAEGRINTSFFIPPHQGVFVEITSKDPSLEGVQVHVRIGPFTRSAVLKGRRLPVGAEVYFTADELKKAGTREVWLSVDPPSET